jgi:hypothetical protein
MNLRILKKPKPRLIPRTRIRSEKEQGETTLLRTSMRRTRKRWATESQE